MLPERDSPAGRVIHRLRLHHVAPTAVTAGASRRVVSGGRCFLEEFVVTSKVWLEWHLNSHADDNKSGSRPRPGRQNLPKQASHCSAAMDKISNCHTGFLVLG